MALEYSERESPEEDPNFYAPIELAVQELSRYDEKSTSFRYPTDETGEPSIPDLAGFDLDAFVEAMWSAMRNLSAMQDFFGHAVECHLQLARTLPNKPYLDSPGQV